MKFGTIYVDMDGVLADYDKEFHRLIAKDPGLKFRQLVLEHQIFKNLTLCKEAQNLLSVLQDYIYEWPSVSLEILSSGGSYIDEIYYEAVNQKENWLDDIGVLWPRNFSHCGESKAKFALPGALLIDDNVVNCKNFRWNEGESFVWGNSINDVATLRKLLDI